MKSEERIPGITFHLEEASLGPSDTHEASGTVLLTADIHDISLWENVVEQFNEMRVYDQDDLKTAMIELLQDDVEKKEKEQKRLQDEAASKVEHLKHALDEQNTRCAHLELELQKKEAELRELRELRALKQQLDSLV